MTQSATYRTNKQRQQYSTPQKPLALTLSQSAALAGKNSLIAFARLTHPNYQPSWHHKVLAAHLEAVERGEIKRLRIHMPPRHGKTELATIRFSAWYLGRNPGKNIIFSTYSTEFSLENSEKAREIVLNPVYRQIFGESLKKNRKALSAWKMEKGGTFYAVGAGGSLTGKGANILLIDDPVKSREEAESETIRKNTWEWYKGTAYTRLEKNAAIIVIMTRWHEDDLAGHLDRESKEDWVTLSLTAIAEYDEIYRKEGEALWTDKLDLKTLNVIKGEVGSREWNSQYQQRPAAAEGEIFKREWWKYYKVQPVFSKIIQSWDTAFKAKTSNDFSVCTTWGVADNGLYLLHRWKGRVEFPELKRTVKNLAEQFKPHEIDIEDKASGQSLLQELQRETLLPIIPVKVDTDKVARANAVTSFIEAGRVFLPELADWLQDYIDTMAVFPNGSHDDDVDSTTQALSKHMYLRKDGVFELYKELYEQKASTEDLDTAFYEANR